MIKTAIALSGRGGSGKTPTIKQAADLFEKRRGVTRESIREIRKRHSESPDILDVFWVNSPKLKVGFASDCDIDDEKYWDELKSKKCDIVVCAVHVRDRTAKNLDGWCKRNKFQSIWIKQMAITMYDEKNALKPFEEQNKLMAELINWLLGVEIQMRS